MTASVMRDIEQSDVYVLLSRETRESQESSEIGTGTPSTWEGCLEPRYVSVCFNDRLALLLSSITLKLY